MISHAPFARRSGLVGHATLAYVVVVVVASLYPAEGWHIPDRVMLWRQLSEWPRFYTYNDVVLNVAAYVPLGWLLTGWLRERLPAMRSAGLAFLATVAASCALEVLQGSIASRVPSGLDVICNAMGGLVGAWLALFSSENAGREGPLARWRARVLAAGRAGDLGFVLLALWVIAQFKPDLWLFTAGDMRHLAGAPFGSYSPKVFVFLEAGVAILGIVAIAGVIRTLSAERPLWLLVVALLLGLAMRSLATSVLFTGGRPLLWMTPGNALGLATGFFLGVAACLLSRRAAALAGFAAILGGAALLNAAPVNPYADIWPVQAWQQGHYRSIAGTTRVISLAWPLLAGVFLFVMGRRER